MIADEFAALLPRATRKSSSSYRSSKQFRWRTGTKAGVAVGVIIFILILILVAFLVWRWRRNKKRRAITTNNQYALK